MFEITKKVGQNKIEQEMMIAYMKLESNPPRDRREDWKFRI